MNLAKQAVADYSDDVAITQKFRRHNATDYMKAGTIVTVTGCNKAELNGLQGKVMHSMDRDSRLIHLTNGKAYRITTCWLTIPQQTSTEDTPMLQDPESNQSRKRQSETLGESSNKTPKTLGQEVMDANPGQSFAGAN